MVQKRCILPDKIRNELKKPLGILFSEKELLNFIKNEKFIVSIGDLVTYTLLKNNFKPLLCIVDYKTKRKKCSKKIIDIIKSYGDERLKVENPPGCITNELWNSIDNSYKKISKKRVIIEVDGEEDLATLPAILLAPNRDVTIIYGMPDKGVVVVKAIEENIIKAKNIINEM